MNSRDDITHRVGVTSDWPMTVIVYTPGFFKADAIFEFLGGL